MNPREQYKKLIQELETLRAVENPTDEQLTRVRGILDELAALKPKIEALMAADEVSREAEKFTRSTGRSTEAAQEPEGRGEGGAGGEGANPSQSRFQGAPAIIRLGRQVTQSARYKSYREDRNPIQVPVQSFYWHQSQGEDGEAEYVRQADRYALIGASEPATMITPQRIPGIAMAQMVRPTVRDAFFNAPTSSNLVQFIREDVENSVNAADFFDETDTAADNVKPESTIAFEEDEAPVRTVATTIPVTDNIIDDVPGFQATIEGRLLDFLKEAEDDALLNGTGTPPEITGLLQTPGIQVLDDAYFATAFNGGALPDAGEMNEDINRLTHAITMIREEGLANPSYVLMSPMALDYFLMITDANRQYLAGNPFSTIGIPRFRGLPIIVTNKLADNQAVVGDGRQAEVRDRMQARVDIGYVDKQFAKNQKTLRAEERLAFAVIRPAAHANVELTLSLGA
jgi:HK97 family phage major capsid protein